MHRIVVDLQTGTVTQVEYTAEEQAVHDALVAEQQVVAPTEALVEPEVIAEPPVEGV
jgi:hypothetical protein